LLARGPVPVGLNLVARLVVMLLAVLVRFRLPIPGGLSDDRLPRIDRERRDPDFPEREVVAAVVMALLRLLVGDDLDAHRLRDALRRRVERRSLDAVHLDVADAAVLGNRVEIDVECDAAGGDRRVLSEPERAEEALLF